MNGIVNGYNSKRDMLASYYQPGMNGNDLAAAVSEAGGNVSASYARQFIRESATSELSEVLTQQGHTIDLLQESLRMLELELANDGWQRFSAMAQQEFSPTGRRRIIELARLMWLKNPIIKRMVEIQQLYVWAQGVTITTDDEDIRTVIDQFNDDERNKAELTTHQPRAEKERQLQTDANLFFTFFINQATGHVRVRTVEPMEIDDIICNPDDAKEPWFYRRQRTRTELNGTMTTVTEYHPDWRFLPISRLAYQSKLLPANTIRWDIPIYHVATNRYGKFGVSEVYAAIDWATAYKSFLENLATVWRSLARFAWNLTTPGGKQGIAAAKAKINTTRTSTGGDTNPPPIAGSTFIASEGGATMTPIRTAGATHSAEDGRRLMLMAVAVSGFPETFFGDASIGTLATAKSLDRPTELKVRNRQTLWADILRNIYEFQLLWAVKAPQGPLRSLGRIERVRDGEQISERVIWNEGINAGISIEFPAIIERDLEASVNAIVSATTLNGSQPAGTLDLRTATRLLLTELGVDEAEELLDTLFPDGVQPVTPQDASGVQEALAQAAEKLQALLREGE